MKNKKSYLMPKRTKRNLRLMLALITALILGLFFIAFVSEAADELEMPTAGFEGFIEEIGTDYEPVLEVDIGAITEYEYYTNPIEPRYILTDREAELLLKIGSLEGGCDGVDGIAHVMQVVMNRVESDRFPNTVEEVIFQTNPLQFTTADKLAETNIISPEAYAALDAVIFSDYGYNDCLFFESMDGYAFDSWSTYVFTYGGHDFYK